MRDRSGQRRRLKHQRTGQRTDSQLHRHTARYPTSDGGKRLLSALDKLRDREVHIPRHHPEFAFLDKADLSLKGWTFDGLMDQGRKA
jgi:hypothetical protein